MSRSCIVVALAFATLSGACVTGTGGAPDGSSGSDAGGGGVGPWPATGLLCDGGMLVGDGAADEFGLYWHHPCESDPDGYPTPTGNAQCAEWAPQFETTGLVHAVCANNHCDVGASACGAPSTLLPVCGCGDAVHGCLFPMICKSDSPGDVPHCVSPCT